MSRGETIPAGFEEVGLWLREKKAAETGPAQKKAFLQCPLALYCHLTFP